jgi:hypothetical protein
MAAAKAVKALTYGCDMTEKYSYTECFTFVMYPATEEEKIQELEHTCGTPRVHPPSPYLTKLPASSTKRPRLRISVSTTAVGVHTGRSNT